MHSYFAAAARDRSNLVQQDHLFVARNALLKEMLNSAGGLAAVLNTKRQVLHLNTGLLQFLGIPDAKQALGLRPGEALDCIHAKEEPGGCGTGRHCRDCGAVIAIVTSLAEKRAVEKDCILQTNQAGGPLHLHVKVSPIDLQTKRFLLLFMHEQKSAKEKGPPISNP